MGMTKEALLAKAAELDGLATQIHNLKKKLNEEKVFNFNQLDKVATAYTDDPNDGIGSLGGMGKPATAENAFAAFVLS